MLTSSGIRPGQTRKWQSENRPHSFAKYLVSETRWSSDYSHTRLFTTVTCELPANVLPMLTLISHNSCLRNLLLSLYWAIWWICTIDSCLITFFKRFFFWGAVYTLRGQWNTANKPSTLDSPAVCSLKGQHYQDCLLFVNATNLHVKVHQSWTDEICTDLSPLANPLMNPLRWIDFCCEVSLF